MAISLATDGLRLNYRTSSQTSVSGTYPIGTVIVIDMLSNSTQTPTLPGTWAFTRGISGKPDVGSEVPQANLAIRLG